MAASAALTARGGPTGTGLRPALDAGERRGSEGAGSGSRSGSGSGSGWGRPRKPSSNATRRRPGARDRIRVLHLVVARAASAESGDGSSSPRGDGSYHVGCGTGDVTGPIDGVGMMGYAVPAQTSRGLWQRQWARAFVVASSSSGRLQDGADPRVPGGETAAIVVVDACMTFPDVKAAALDVVATALEARGESSSSAPLASPYREDNVLVCATHTHAAPGGYAPHGLYNVTFGGGVRASFDAMRDGIAAALLAAHDDMRPGARVSLGAANLKGAAVNRSKVAYERNPEEERARYDGDVDDAVAVLSFTDEGGDVACAVRGVIAWYAVHGTSLRSSSRVVSGDNKGVASWLAETALRGDRERDDGGDDGVRAVLEAFSPVSLSEERKGDVLRDPEAAANAVAIAAAAGAAAGVWATAGRIGRGHGAVVAFPQSASGDVSPNTRGAWCQKTNGGGDVECSPCNPVTGACSGSVTACAGRGPAGDDDAASCVAIGGVQAAAALRLVLKAMKEGGTSRRLRGDLWAGTVGSAHAWLPIGRGLEVDGEFTRDGRPGVTASPALGYSFAAGTTDGPGADGFLQSDTCQCVADSVVPETKPDGKRKKRRFLGALASWVVGGFRLWGVPREAQEAHAPKPILIHFSNEAAPWVSLDVPVQMMRIGTLLIAAVPAEVTTMAGRRIRERVLAAVTAASNDDTVDWEVIVTGLANGYAGYVTTPEEYDAQRYEGASTLYGQHTLGAYTQTLVRLTTELVQAPTTPTTSDAVRAQTSHTSAQTRSQTSREPGPAPRWGLQSAVPPVDMRWPPWRQFGDCLEDVHVGGGDGGAAGGDVNDPRSDGRPRIVIAGASGAAGTVTGVFVAGRPRRAALPGCLGSYLVVERLLRGCGLDGLESSFPRWVVMATDDDLSTTVEWTAVGPLGLGSRLALTWSPPVGTPPGCYRLGVKGAARGFRRWLRDQEAELYEGYTSNFFVAEGTPGAVATTPEEVQAERGTAKAVVHEAVVNLPTVLYRFAE